MHENSIQLMHKHSWDFFYYFTIILYFLNLESFISIKKYIKLSFSFTWMGVLFLCNSNLCNSIYFVFNIAMNITDIISWQRFGAAFLIAFNFSPMRNICLISCLIIVQYWPIQHWSNETGIHQSTNVHCVNFCIAFACAGWHHKFMF